MADLVLFSPCTMSCSPPVLGLSTSRSSWISVSLVYTGKVRRKITREGIVRYARPNGRVFARVQGEKEEEQSTREVDAKHEGVNPVRANRRVILGASLLLSLSLHVQKVSDAEAATTSSDKRKLWGLGEEPAPNGTGDQTRVYDALVLGEPVAITKDRERVWQKLLASRVVYLGEAERVPDPDDKVLELEIMRALRDRCFDQKRPVTLAIEAFPCLLQVALNEYMNKSLDKAGLKALVPEWPEGRWEEFEPLLEYCRDNGVRLMACGAPPEVLRTVQAKGIQGLSVGDRKRYAPPVQRGSALSYEIFQQAMLPEVLQKASVPFGPGPYRFAQARIVEDHTMAQVVQQALTDSGTLGMVVVITGASHVYYGARGSGLPARMAKVLPKKKTQTVILLNPERQHIRQEGEIPQADFLWYSAAKVCVRNCFDRAEVARVMSAAGRRREALPEDIQAGLDRGVISPELLQTFFDLDSNPVLAELTKRFQGLRERLLADPRFLHRLAIEEAISITTTLLAQFERRKDRFWKELDYVITDTVRGTVVDFFTVWLPAPRLAFRFDEDVSGGGLQGLLGSIPDNAFQRAHTGMSWDPSTRFLAVLVGGVKLFCVGFVSSVGTLSLTNGLLNLRRRLNPEVVITNKRSPIFKTAAVYATFLGLSANLRYQIVAGVVEHWIADYFLASNPLAGNIISFVARTANSYWGTQQWVDLARIVGLQAHNEEKEESLTKEEQVETSLGIDTQVVRTDEPHSMEQK